MKDINARNMFKELNSGVSRRSLVKLKSQQNICVYLLYNICSHM